ncbi:hypothetical protein DFH07DRAFT_441094 [Mycena maculata]|uniref:F-box domain-containing protein n=1 Tax=Mycena maculata TaxID=230809 RepID=A0AAD7NHF3_9AGAR|nr:hypothetical protein DFH07DRAFT_441094 [Mycena maculata]
MAQKTVESLPTELLMKIFKLTRPSREEAIHLGKISVDHGAWGIARVCGRWRATVLDMPCMWTDMVISIPVGTASWVNYPVTLVKEHIARGGDDPMRVTLLSEEVPGYTTAKLFAALAYSSRRWETLELAAKWPLPTEALMRMRDNIPLLREIHICADSESGFVGGHVFEIAPSLQIVRITEPRLHADNRNMNWRSPDYNSDYNDSFMWPRDPPFEPIFPWAQLTHYESQCMDPFHFTALFLAANLTVCQATVIPEARHHAWRAPAHLVRFEHLQKLTLFAPAPLLDALVLPALQDLFIEVFPRDFPHVVDLLRRSKCSLRKFWIKSHPPVQQYRAVLETNAHIEELGIIGRESLRHIFGADANVDSIIRALGAVPTLVPNLQAFYIHDQSADLDMDAVVDMVEGRMPTLERLCITECEARVFPRKARARITKLQERGLEVQFKREHERWAARGLLEYV